MTWSGVTHPGGKPVFLAVKNKVEGEAMAQLKPKISVSLGISRCVPRQFRARDLELATFWRRLRQAIPASTETASFGRRSNRERNL